MLSRRCRACPLTGNTENEMPTENVLRRLTLKDKKMPTNYTSTPWSIKQIARNQVEVVTVDNDTVALLPYQEGEPYPVNESAYERQLRHAKLIVNAPHFYQLLSRILAEDLSKAEIITQTRTLIRAYDATTIDTPFPKVPYPMHCVQPAICAGKNCCPRDPVCID